MRFKKGSKVEVFFKDEVPSGSWCCAEVISGNGHCYTVRCATGAQDEVIFENVSVKLIRPFPPLVTIPACWMAGDVVEVLHDCSWKMATVSKVLRGNNFLVRLVGALNEFKVCKLDIRLRQSWIDGKWVIVGKGCGNYDDKKCNEPSSIYNWKSGSIKRIKANLDSHEEKGYVGTENNIDFKESHLVSRKSMKRGFHSHNLYPQAKAHESTKKFRAYEQHDRCHQVIVENSSPLPENLGYCACPNKNPEEKEMHSSLNNRTGQFFEMDELETRTNGAFGFSQFRSSEFGNADDVTSSVGSCGIIRDNLIEWHSRILSCPVERAEGHFSDAESVCRLQYDERNSLSSNEEELDAAIHRLELHAYRCTLEALHASGPLSWEQETLMTNLRISLHISNDEHLMELRKLISNATSIPIC